MQAILRFYGANFLHSSFMSIKGILTFLCESTSTSSYLSWMSWG